MVTGSARLTELALPLGVLGVGQQSVKAVFANQIDDCAAFLLGEVPTMHSGRTARPRDRLFQFAGPPELRGGADPGKPPVSRTQPRRRNRGNRGPEHGAPYRRAMEGSYASGCAVLAGSGEQSRQTPGGHCVEGATGFEAGLKVRIGAPTDGAAAVERGARLTPRSAVILGFRAAHTVNNKWPEIPPSGSPKLTAWHF